MTPHTPPKISLDITWQSLFKILSFAVGMWLIINLQDVILMLFGVFLLVAMVSPSITKLQQYMSRPLAVLLFYTILLLVIILLLSSVLPILVQQLNDLARAVPSIANRVEEFV